MKFPAFLERLLIVKIIKHWNARGMHFSIVHTLQFFVVDFYHVKSESNHLRFSFKGELNAKSNLFLFKSIGIVD